MLTARNRLNMKEDVPRKKSVVLIFKKSSNVNLYVVLIASSSKCACICTRFIKHSCIHGLHWSIFRLIFVTKNRFIAYFKTSSFLLLRLFFLLLPAINTWKVAETAKLFSSLSIINSNQSGLFGRLYRAGGEGHSTEFGR